MANQRVEIEIKARTPGRSNARGLRVSKMIPGVVYGATSNTPIAVAEGAIVKYNTRAYENALFNLKGEKLSGVVALLKEVVINPLTRRPEHVDFFALDLKKTVRIAVEIRLEGKPIGLSEGGLLSFVNRTIDIECLPTEIPDAIVGDVSNLGVGDALHISDLKIPAGLKVMSQPELTVAVVNIVEEEKAAPAADAAAAPAAAGAAAPAAAGAAAPAAAKAGDAKAAAPAAGAKPAAKTDKK